MADFMHWVTKFFNDMGVGSLAVVVVILLLYFIKRFWPSTSHWIKVVSHPENTHWINCTIWLVTWMVWGLWWKDELLCLWVTRVPAKTVSFQCSLSISSGYKFQHIKYARVVIDKNTLQLPPSKVSTNPQFYWFTPVALHQKSVVFIGTDMGNRSDDCWQKLVLVLGFLVVCSWGEDTVSN